MIKLLKKIKGNYKKLRVKLQKNITMDFVPNVQYKGITARVPTDIHESHLLTRVTHAYFLTDRLCISLYALETTVSSLFCLRQKKNKKQGAILQTISVSNGKFSSQSEQTNVNSNSSSDSEINKKSNCGTWPFSLEKSSKSDAKDSVYASVSK